MSRRKRIGVLTGGGDCPGLNAVIRAVDKRGTPSSFDRLLATRYGSAAVELAARDAWGCMVALQGNRIVDVAIEDAIGQLKRINPDGELIRVARAMGIEFGG